MAQNVVVGVVLHLHDMAVAAGCHQTEEGRFELWMGQVKGRNVAPQVMHRNQRLVGRIGQPLGKVHTHQHRADQARRKGDSHRVHIVHGLACVQQSLFDRGADELAVAAAGDLGDHAAISACSLTLVEMTLLSRRRPSSTRDAAVSSQVDSIPKTIIVQWASSQFLPVCTSVLRGTA